MTVTAEIGVRRREPELMDQPGLDPDRHRRALRDLSRLNAWSGSARLLAGPIFDLARRLAPRPVLVLDLACGGGDVARRLAARAARAGLDVRIDGCDLSPKAVDLASRCAPPRSRFFGLDALRDPLPEGYDVLCCSLFLHHLEEPDAVRLLARMAAAARRMVLVNDLERGRSGLALAWAATRLLTSSDVVHTDALLSVRAAFTLEEARRLADRAGLAGAMLRRRWPFRWLLRWERP